jgi:hypothetical protein
MKEALVIVHHNRSFLLGEKLLLLTGLSVIKIWSAGSNKTNFLAFSAQAKYTDRSTETCRRILVPTFADRGVSRGQRDGTPTAINLSFVDRSRYFSFK